MRLQVVNNPDRSGVLVVDENGRPVHGIRRARIYIDPPDHVPVLSLDVIDFDCRFSADVGAEAFGPVAGELELGPEAAA